MNQKFDFKIEEGDYETIAGFITSRSGRIPAEGETITIDNFTILIVKASIKKIEVIKLTQIHE